MARTDHKQKARVNSNGETHLDQQELIAKVFRVAPRKWRGFGEIPQSGLGLAPDYAAYDAEHKFGVADYTAEESTICIAGDILRGVKKPHDCPAFGTLCTPETPLGATMVSNEGACSAYYRYKRREAQSQVSR